MNSIFTFCIFTLLLGTLTPMSRGIPPRVANRMIPSWWFTAKNVCYYGSDCDPEECCARPMLSANSYCMPFKRRAEVCDATPMMLDPENEVYFGDCPCNEHLTCAGLQTRSVCVDLRNFEIDFQRLYNQRNLETRQKPEKFQNLPSSSARF